MTDVATADIMAKTISAIVGDTPEEGEHSSVGVELTQKATEAIEVVALESELSPETKA